MYIKIKNAIIALLLTVMYEGWIVGEITKARLITILFFAFFFFFSMLEMADAEFVRVNRRAKKREKTWED